MQHPALHSSVAPTPCLYCLSNDMKSIAGVVRMLKHLPRPIVVHFVQVKAIDLHYDAII
jgi:hypothetical protein